MEATFANRAAGGRQLAQILHHYADDPSVIVLGLPRGGVPVAFEIARHLRAPLDVFLVRKLGVPGYEELAMGAIASGGVRVLNETVLRQVPNGVAMLDLVTVNERAELERRERSYRGGAGAVELEGKTAILVDDGMATGASMRAAIGALRLRAVARIVVAVPVGAAETCAEIAREVDEVIVVLAPPCFHAVGRYYEDFTQTTDDEVHALLGAAAMKIIKSG